eukprot:TRINITY_DN2438_c0_g3_i1.p1 TRINITY_DN2438_c0_g3~~TRINITY_DN2438_c0_g3_i1.p1  ORF type:complete len:1485 (-),score=345.48 TRINITY_DN2438_c0_g3_i1:42-4496(-)
MVTKREHDLLQQAEDLTKKQLIQIFLYIYYGLIPLVMYYWVVAPVMRDSCSLALCLCVTIVVTFKISIRRGQFLTVAWIVCAMTPLMLPMWFNVRGMPSLVTLKLYMCPAITGVLGGTVVAVTNNVMVAAMYVVCWLLHYAGYQFPVVALDEPLERQAQVINWIIATIFFGICIPVMETNRNRPIFALRTIRQQRQQAICDLAQETTKLRTAVSVYSHEIRTPLNAVGAITDSIVEAMSGVKSAQCSQEGSLIQTQTKCLLVLANNVLDVSAIEAHSLRIEHAVFHLNAVLRCTKKQALTVAAVKNIKFELSKEHTLPRSIIGDGIRLQQVLSNLIANALAATRSGTVHIDVREVRQHNADNVHIADVGTVWIEFCVTDSGEGIPEDIALFQKFQTSDFDAKKTRTTLGLFISRKIVQRMGGRISIASRIRNCGTIVKVALPFSLPCASGFSSQSSSDSGLSRLAHQDDTSDIRLLSGRHADEEEQPKRRSLKILYADDEPANHFVLRTLLQGESHIVHCVDNGRQAVDAVKAERYDIVLLDVEMPLMNGIEAMHAIRSFEAESNKSPVSMSRTQSAVMESTASAAQQQQPANCVRDRGESDASLSKRRSKRVPIAFLTAHTSYAFAKLDVDNVIPKPVVKSWLLEAINIMVEPSYPQMLSRVSPLSVGQTFLQPTSKHNSGDMLDSSSPRPFSSHSASHSDSHGIKGPRMRKHGSALSSFSVDSTASHAEKSSYSSSTQLSVESLAVQSSTESLLQRVIRKVDAPPAILADPTRLWKYRLLVAVTFMNITLLPLTIAFWATFSVPSRVVLWAIATASYFVYAPLMRLDANKAWVLSWYTIVQQTTLVYLTVHHSEFGCDALALGHVFPPITVLLSGGSGKLSMWCSFIVSLEGAVLAFLQPWRGPDDVVVIDTMAYMTSAMICHVMLTTLLTLYVSMADKSRRRLFDELAYELEHIARVQKKTQKKRDTTEQFIQSVSSDFKGPLSIVLGIAEVLESEDKVGSDKVQRHLHILKNSCQLLLNMMHNILDVRSVEYDQAIQMTHNRVFRLRDIILQSARMLSFHAQAKHQLIRVHIAHSVPDYVFDDGHRLQQVLVNLIGTTIKFSAPGSIIVHVDTSKTFNSTIDPSSANLARGIDCERYVFTGTDRDDVVASLEAQLLQRKPLSEVERIGAGLPLLGLDKYEPVIMRFTVMDNSEYTRAATSPMLTKLSSTNSTSSTSSIHMNSVDAGASVTLRVSRALIQEMGGVLQDSTRAGMGFVFSIPVKTVGVEEYEAECQDGDLNRPWGQAQTIMIVDECSEMQYVYSRFLKGTPHRIITASSANDALRIFRKEQIDTLILGETSFADMTIVDLLYAMECAKFNDLPFVIALARVQPSEVLRGHFFSAGVTALESKPISRLRLLSLLRAESRCVSSEPTCESVQSALTRSGCTSAGELMDDIGLENTLEIVLPLQKALQEMQVSRWPTAHKLADYDMPMMQLEPFQ